MDGLSLLAGIVAGFVLSALIGLTIDGFLAAANRREHGE
jgi:hypothetical protein